MSAENRQTFEVVRDYLRKDPERFVPAELKPYAKEVIEFVTESHERFAIIPVLATAMGAIDPTLLAGLMPAARRMFREMQQQEDARIATQEAA